MRIRAFACVSGALALGLTRGSPAALPVLGAPVPVTMVGDANGDGIADGLDLQIVQQNMDKTGGLGQGDFDGNGRVNSSDLTLLNSYFQRRLPAVLFGKIADRATAIPGGSGTFNHVSGPVMDRFGNVAFLGSNFIHMGAYRWSAGALSKVADNGTPAPGGGAFSNIGQPAATAGRVAFEATAGGQDGLFSYSAGGTLTKLVGQSTTRPEGGTFPSLGDPTAFNGTTLFVGGGPAYTVSGTTLTREIASGTAVPGGTGTFTRIETPLTDGSNLWFIGRGIGQFGIYRKSGGTLSTLLDQNTAVTGTNSKFTSVGNLSLDGANLSFTGEFNNTSGVFGVTGSTVNKIADTTTKIPGGSGQFSSFGVSSAGGSSVAFVGFDKSRNPGIYAWIAGELNRVVDASMTMGGKIISSLGMTTSAVAGNKVVFQADFTDGSSGIFSASMFPTRVPGDVNNDGKVDGADFAIVQKNLGLTGGRSSGDLTGDGLIDVADFQVLERNFGRTGIAPLLGDANGDDKVDNADLRIFFANYGRYGAIPQADFTGDGRVDFADFQAMELNYGKVSAGAYDPFGPMAASAEEVLARASVPEPGGLGVVLMAAAAAGAGVLPARRRRPARGTR